MSAFALALTFPLLASPLDDAAALQDGGEFKKADAVLAAALKTTDLPAEQRKKLEWEKDRIQRIRNDYQFRTDDLFRALSKSVKNLTRDEFEKWIALGWFDGRNIDGTMRYVGTSVSNLYFRHPELNARRTPPKDTTGEQKGRLKLAREIIAATKKEHSPYVLPRHFRCTMIVSVDVGAVPNGEMVRAWLPIPRHNQFQDNIKVISSSSPVKNLAPDTSTIRSAYMEQRAEKGKPTKFRLVYEYGIHGVHFDLDAKNVQPSEVTDSELKRYTSEAPHVVFTDKIKQLAHEIAGNETNPLLNAKASYDWIAKNIQYSFAREYSTLTNLSDYTCSNRYGDCGQEALLFITLCRVQGIPARWQTGWNIFPKALDIHDWTEIYIAPYGWMPVDPWAGIFSHQYCTALTETERAELQNFYFGGLDPYRMIANSDHSQQLQPAKQTMRSDDVDFQRGEVEWKGGNIYFNDYSYSLQVEELKN
ncbi:MAG: transglutaminase-like domain-containing protein [Limisphaerales bacterium]